MSVGIVDKQTGERIPTAGMPAIDNALSATSTNPVQNAIITAALADKQDKTDNSLQTTDKTVVGAINEHEGDISSLMSGFTNLDNEVNGDATEYHYADVITIEDAVPSNLADCSVKIEPVQDLHGYDHPWVGGAGKNKLPLVLADIKAANTDGTWNGNVYTINGGTFTIYTDDGGNVTKIVANGTFSTRSTLRLRTSNDNYVLTQGSYIVSKGFTNSNVGIAIETFNGTTWVSRLTASTSTDNVSFTVDYDGYDRLYVYLEVTNTSSAVNETFYPMIRLATETDATFAPYTNLCPISGHTEVSVKRDGRNLFKTTMSDGTTGGITYTKNADGSVSVSGTRTSAAQKTIGEAHVTSSMGTITVSGLTESTNIVLNKIRLYDKNNNELFQRSTFGTIDNLADYPTLDRVTVEVKGNGDGSVASGKVTIKVELGETATAWEPYSGKTYTIALGDTIYGGTVDFNTGVMTVDRVIVDLGTLTWQKDSGVSHSRFVANNVGMKLDGKAIADCFQYSTYNEVYAHTKDEAISISNVYSQFAIHSTYYEADYDATQFKTAMDGHYACYELATPLTIQLTPQQIQLLQGTNTISASTGKISVTVNGVSGAIGSLTSDKQDKTDYALETTEKTVVGAINEIKDSLATVVPTPASDVTITKGGYVKIGDLVLVDFYFTVSGTHAANTRIAILPSTAVNNASLPIYNITDETTLSGGRMYETGLFAGDALVADKTYNARGLYVKA